RQLRGSQPHGHPAGKEHKLVFGLGNLDIVAESRAQSGLGRRNGLIEEWPAQSIVSAFPYTRRIDDTVRGSRCQENGSFPSESSGPGQKPVLVDQPVVPEMIR